MESEEKNEKRLFVAVDLPENIKEEIAKAGAKLPKDGIRPVAKENLHITLKFIGEVGTEKIEEIKAKLRTIKMKGFDCELKGVGVFPNENYIRVVWIAIESEELPHLAQAVETALKGIGKKEDREFSPHLTIARVSKKIDLRDFLEKNKNREFGKFTVCDFALFESTLTPNGPIYKKIENYEL